MTQLLFPLTLVAAITAAVVGGVFLSFSDFVMHGLGAALHPGGMRSMQALNRTVYRSVFIVLFLGLTPLTLGLAAFGFGTAGKSWLLAAAAVYTTSVFVVTAAGNVPLNQKLDALDADTNEGRAAWEHYIVSWTRLNHVRTAGSIVAAVCLLGAALQLGG